MLSSASLPSRLIAIFILGAAMAHSVNAAPPDDACSLLTPAQVTGALGVSVAAGTYVTPTFRKTCTWSATTNGGGTVTLNLQSLEQYEGGKKLASYGKSVHATPSAASGMTPITSDRQACQPSRQERQFRIQSCSVCPRPD